MLRNKALKLIPALLALATTVLPVVPSQAAPSTARIQYTKSKDGRYIYIRSATQLEIGNPEQERALQLAFERIKGQIDDLKMKSPRVGNTGKIDAPAIKAAADGFDKDLDGIVSYMQKYYGELDSLRQYANMATPSGLLIFTGLNWSKTLGWSAVKVLTGGSIVMGLVIVPQNIRRIEVDTGKIDEYVDFDTAIVFWQSGDFGLAAGNNSTPVNPAPANPAPPTGAAGTPAVVPGLKCIEGSLAGTQRLGMGFIWGRLDQAADFHGMISGVSASVGYKVRGNLKLQALTNWSRKQAISNVFATAAVECGDIAPWDVHGSIGAIVNATDFMGASAGKANSPEEVLANAAAKVIDRESSGNTSSGPAPGINPLPLNPGAPPLIQ